MEIKAYERRSVGLDAEEEKPHGTEEDAKDNRKGDSELHS